MYLLGFDIGSSSIKASLVDARTSAVMASARSPELEMDIQAPRPDWAEQDPDVWWQHCRLALRELFRKTDVRPSQIAAVGISYQMHGLVALDAEGRPLRPAIIWCDSRAVAVGDKALADLGEDYCFDSCLNAPGNFTASKLAWVKQNEAAVFEKIRKVMLPGDYIAFRLTGEALTTASGLSEGILWDFRENKPASRLLDYYGIPGNLLPEIAPTFGIQGKIHRKAAEEFGLPEGIPVSYRAGDQPNNALSLNVLHPGEIAATGGTSGVVYGVVDRPAADRKGRVNSFAHVNHDAENPRIGVLLCINGAGIQYGWMRRQTGGENVSYSEMEALAASVPAGSEGLRVLPFGNGAERLFRNQNPGAQILNLQFNRHNKAHLYRAALEGVAFSFVYGVQSMAELGLAVSTLRAGNDNLFQSDIFSSTIADLLGCRIELLKTTGAAGAAIAAGVGVGLWNNPGEGLGRLESAGVYEPASSPQCIDAYADWVERLEKIIGQ